MKLGISTRGLNQGSYAISSMILYIVRELIELTGDDHKIYLYHNDPQHEGLFPSTIKNRSIKIENRILWDHFWLPKMLKKDGIDVALFFKGTISERIPCKSMVFFNDLGYFDTILRPYPVLETIYMRMMMTRAAKKADLVFTISDFTRQEVLRHIGISNNKVNVSYLSCTPDCERVEDSARLDVLRKKYNLSSRFIFCPVSVSPRKNLPRILEAFASVRDLIPHQLVITGSQASGQMELRRGLSEGRYSRVRLLGAVPYEDMPGLYTLADFTLFPSLLEGFGVPLVEAFRCGSPVLTSNITSMPEIAGDAALFVDPYEVKKIADGILKLSFDEGLKADLVRRGKLRSEEFSWRKTAQSILAGMGSL